MATIYDLNTSITLMSRHKFYSHLREIRANRRTRPAPKRKAPAKVARAPKRSNLKQHNIFQYTNGLTDAKKKQLAAELMEALMKS